MAGFLYFVEHRKGITKKDIEELGLKELYGDAEVTGRGSGNGPSSVGGYTFIFKPEGLEGKTANLGFFPENQTWIKAPGKDYWIGFENDNKPGPEDLIKDEMINGYWEKLEDGNDWAIPVARSLDSKRGLPKVMAIGEDGKLVRKPIKQFQSISAKAERAWDVIKNAFKEQDDREPGISEMEDDEGIEIAIEALCVNYTIDRSHALFLEIVSTRNYEKVLLSLVDYKTFLLYAEIVKEKSEGNASDLIKKKSPSALNGETLSLGQKA